MNFPRRSWTLLSRGPDPQIPAVLRDQELFEHLGCKNPPVSKGTGKKPLPTKPLEEYHMDPDDFCGSWHQDILVDLHDELTRAPG